MFFFCLKETVTAIRLPMFVSYYPTSYVPFSRISAVLVCSCFFCCRVAKVCKYGDKLRVVGLASLFYLVLAVFLKLQVCVWSMAILLYCTAICVFVDA